MKTLQKGQIVQRFVMVVVLLMPVSFALSDNSAMNVTVSGQVCAEDTGNPINGALVRIAVPATDMRFVRISTSHKIYQTNTNNEGNFSIVLPLNDTNDISVDVLAKGYRSAAGTYNSGGDFSLYKIAIKPDQQINLSIKLPKALYIAGTVIDNSGKAISGVRIQGRMMLKNGYADIGSTESDTTGRFEIFDFPPAKNPDETGVLQFWHPQFEDVHISDIYEKNQDDLTALKIIMPRGLKVTGILLDSSGKPAVNTRVEAMACGTVIKNYITDSNGQFELAGLKQGPIILHAIANNANQKAMKELMLLKEESVILKLEPIELEKNINTVTLLGMQLADETPALKKLYDLSDIAAVVILNPGVNHERLGIGKLEKGFSFWIIGDKKISNMKEMISEILRINALPKPPAGTRTQEGYHGFVRVVYLMRSGTNTQYLRLSDEDTKQLREVGKQLGIPQEKLY
jgi:hypothetical protein